MMIGAIISGLFSVGGQWMKNRQEKAQAKHEREVKVIQNEANWDITQAQNSGASWKDEYLTIVLTSPFVAMFVDVLLHGEAAAEKYKVAFKVLDESVPDEYWYLLSVVVAASFGVKKIIDIIKAKRGG